jgi:hypothetical protein
LQLTKWDGSELMYKNMFRFTSINCYVWVLSVRKFWNWIIDEFYFALVAMKYKIKFNLSQFKIKIIHHLVKFIWQIAHRYVTEISSLKKFKFSSEYKGVLQHYSATNICKKKNFWLPNKQKRKIFKKSEGKVL